MSDDLVPTTRVIELYEDPTQHMEFHVVRVKNLVPRLRWHGAPATDMRQAFRIALNKWQILAKNTYISGCLSGGASTCGLCHMYWENGVHGYCGECPIKKSTGQILCRQTPCEDYAKTMLPEDAQRELEFLIDLAAKNGFTVMSVYEEASDFPSAENQFHI